MEETKGNKFRTFSATAMVNASQKPRPGSSVLTAITAKKEIIETIYGVCPNLPTQPSRHSSVKQLRKIQQGNYPPQSARKFSVKINKQKDDLLYYNLQLKKSLNKLVYYLCLQKGKLYSAKKKSNKYSKILNMYHYKYIYWGTTTNSHLVTGIKSKYEYLQNKYQYKCEEYEQMIKTVEQSREREYKVYIKALEVENHQLSEKLEQMAVKSVNIITPTSTFREATEKIVAGMEAERDAFIVKYKELETKYKMSCEGLADRNRKIVFLEKLIIEKDNNYHAMHRKVKKMEKYLLDMQSLSEYKCRYLNYQISQLHIYMETVKEYADKSLKHQYQAAEGAARSLYDTILRLKRYNEAFDLTIKYLRSNNSLLNKQYLEAKQSKNESDRRIKHSNSFNQQYTLNYKRQYETNRRQYDSKVIVFDNTVNGKRVQRRADQKNSEISVRKRKVYLRDVEHIGMFLKYKFMGLKVPIESVKGEFDYKLIEDSLNVKDNYWGQYYITMGNVYSVLTNKLFGLSYNDANQLARYIIEDTDGYYAYCDDLNENRRSIVKSILKSVIGEYTVESSEYEAKMTVFLNKYRSSLKTLISGNASNNRTISRNKFIDLLKGSGIDIEEGIKEALIGKMAVKAKNIMYLEFDSVF